MRAYVDVYVWVRKILIFEDSHSVSQIFHHLLKWKQNQ